MASKPKPLNNGGTRTQKWLLVVLGILLLNAAYVISTTMNFQSTSILTSSDSSTNTNNIIELDDEPSAVVVDVMISNTNNATNANDNANAISKEGTETVGSKEEQKGQGSAVKIMTAAEPNDIDKIKVKVADETNENDPKVNFPAKYDSDNSDRNSTDFTRYDDVVIVTKVLWANDLQKVLIPSLCYLSHAYNDKRKYDIVVFTTLPWTEAQIAELQAVVAPAKLTVALEAPPLEEQVAAMTKEEKDFLYKRCNVTEGEDIRWFHYCTEPGTRHKNNLGYCWQAEFRSYHIWTHPAIMKYKYMIWMDSDTKVATHWDGNNDPMKMMVENNLNLLFSGFPYGKATNLIIKEKMEKAYNKSICRVFKTDGYLNAHMCKDDNDHFELNQVAGNHHISNLETYRKPIHQKFLKDFVGDYRFARQFDDQIAITIPAVMEDGNKAWHERSHGLVLKIGHHKMFDNVASDKSPRNWKEFYNQMKDSFTGLERRCGKHFLRP